MRRVVEHRFFVGDSLKMLKCIPDESVHCCITSPPYFGLRDYGVPGQIGLEEEPAMFVSRLVAVFREVRRVLRPDGTLWLNLGDAHSHGGCGARDAGRWPKQSRNDHMPLHAKAQTGLKQKDLVGIPWLVAFALRADGWYWRSTIPWLKGNCMPESTTDRPTSAVEYWFLLAKSGTPQYWTHRDKTGTRVKPQPDYRWINTATGEETVAEPPDWRTAKTPDGRKVWRRINLWTGHDYYYDAEAIKKPAMVGDHPRSVDCRYQAPGQPRHNGLRKPGLAMGGARAPKVKVPSGWDTKPGAHRTIHREGRTRDPEYREGEYLKRNRRDSDWFMDSIRAILDGESGTLLHDEDGLPIAVFCNTTPFKEAHFATFPERLIIPMVLASTSEKACPACGAPWERVTEKGEPVPTGKGGSRKMVEIVKQFRGEKSTETSCFSTGAIRPSITAGVHPTCNCPDNDGSGVCVVLDPFGGSGTVSAVAKKLGRASIYIDLNPQYAEMAKRRLGLNQLTLFEEHRIEEVIAP
jgi:DNA modification methylase